VTVDDPMIGDDAAVIILVGLYAVMNGVNDGGSLVANGLKISSIRLGPSIALLSGSIAVVPLILGTRVADTLANRLVQLEGSAGQRAVAVALVATIGVVLVLARLGLPTSLTLATIGGLTGSGLGMGRTVDWATLGIVLLLAALAPLVGGVFAYLLVRASRRLSVRSGVGRIVATGHRGAYALQCVAYAANDGQKLLAMAILALGVSSLAGPSLAVTLAILAMLFLAGTAIGVRRMAATLSVGVLPVRPLQAVAAEVSAGTAVLGTAFLGAPVSMTQAITGALVGSGVSDGARRIRWRAVLSIAAAWVVTLPAAVLLAAGVGIVLEVLV
jgi:inorganic phosphate transporter, PiT family